MMLQGKKILVTGGAGFIGSHLTERLVKERAQVSIIDNVGASSSIEAFKKDVEFYTCNLADYEKVNSTIRKINPEIIFHLASYAFVDPKIDIDFILKNDFYSTINLLKALNGEFELFVHTGSVAEYGNGEVPFKEDQAPVANSPYALAKIFSTKYCQLLNRRDNLPIIILRPFLTYGPRQNNFKMLIPSIILHALREENFPTTKGEQTRDCIYVKDVVEGYIKSANSQKAIGEIINIGTAKEISVKNLILKIIELTNSKIRPEFGALPYRPADSMRSFCSNEKVKALLAWQPKYSLDEGLKETIDWYKKNLILES
ncbi:MAG: GDP-mannose 4,6-dehydratase [Nanoarchaeota archaeon]